MLNLKCLTGLIIALLFPLILKVSISYAPESMNNNIVNAVGLVGFWVIATLLLILVTKYETKQLDSIGIKKLSKKNIALAIFLGLILSLTVPVFTILANKILPVSNQDELLNSTNVVSIGILIFSIITAAVTEEIIYRGYIITRLENSGMHKYFAATISILFFSLVHASTWGISHILGVVLPLGLILTFLFMWKRNLWFVILIHLFIDLPLIFIALK
jgi:uncharacterized protein